MESGKTTEVLSSFQERHPNLHTFIYKLLILIVTFYCWIAIARYRPASDDPFPKPIDDTNLTTLHFICAQGGVLEDFVDFGPPNALIPAIVLCPPTPIFLLALLTFTTGIYKLHSLPKQGGKARSSTFGIFCMTFGRTIVQIDWLHNFWATVQFYVPLNTWGISFAFVLVVPAMSWMARTFFGGWVARYREMVRRKEEELRVKTEQNREVGDMDIEMGKEQTMVQGEVDEGTSLRGWLERRVAKKVRRGSV